MAHGRQAKEVAYILLHDAPYNLWIVTVCAGGMLFAMGLFGLGLFGLGRLVRYVPVPIVIGFTNGIAVLIALSQAKDWLGLGLVVALVTLSLLAWGWCLPEETIGTRFGGIAQTVPAFALPDFSWETVKMLVTPALAD